MIEAMSVFIAVGLWLIAFELGAIKKILQQQQAAGGSTAAKGGE